MRSFGDREPLRDRSATLYDTGCEVAPLRLAPPWSPTMALATLDPSHLAALLRILGDSGLRSDDAALDAYGRDETEDLLFRPAAVALPESTAQVAAVLRLAASERIPVTPRGAGTGLSGGALPVRGGLVLTLERMNRIRELDARNMTVLAEAGVVTGRLQEEVERHGLFYPPDPGSRDTCLLGGNLAEDAAGPHSCRYGTTRKWVLGLEAVRPDGEVIHTGSANRKDVVGYNLTQLLVGSEGTLAVITAARLRLIARPSATVTLALPFPDLERAAAAVPEIFLADLDPASCEILEEAALAAVAQTHELPAALSGAGALLFLELHGDREEALLDVALRCSEVASAHDGGEPLVATDAREQRRLWAIRKVVAEAVKAKSVYKEADTVVPRASLADLVRASREVARRHGLEAISYGQAGDGNLHVNLLRGDLGEREWNERRDRAENELFDAVLALGGTITGEHGIGYTQRRLMPRAVDSPTLESMRSIKRAFDPHGILNPAKIFPDPR
jgi:glycolate oxidase